MVCWVSLRQVVCNTLSLEGHNLEVEGWVATECWGEDCARECGNRCGRPCRRESGTKAGRERVSVADCERGDDFLLVNFVSFVADAFAYRVGKRVGILSYGGHGAKFKPLVVVEGNEVDFFFQIAAF